MEVRINCITQPIIKMDECDENGEYTIGMSAEEYLIYAARVSAKERVNNETASKLLSFLIKHKHWSPFEMISIGIEIKTSRAIAQQILRHRSFSFQEFSQRYAEVVNIETVQLRYQAESNRQSSTNKVESAAAAAIVKTAVEGSVAAYKELLQLGVAKECARMVLPLTTQTTIIMHGTLRSWIHFFEQRCSKHAQQEIQDIAYEARKQISKVCPWTAKALGWEDK